MQDWVRSPPAAMSWATRIVVLRDPDGHLVELYALLDEAESAAWGTEVGGAFGPRLLGRGLRLEG